jgi:hypothetical protein
MTDREAYEPRGVRHTKAPLEEMNQDVCSLLLSLAQGDCLPVHGARVTESLSSRPMPSAAPHSMKNVGGSERD